MVTLRALGALDLRDATGAPLESVLAQTKRAALLAYLVLSRPGELHRRDALLALFWPEVDEARGRSALSQALSFLRRELGDDVLVTRGGEEVGVDPGRVRCDVLMFREALGREDWAGALELYQGDLLEGLHAKEAPDFGDWVDRERVRLKEAAAGAAWRWAHQLLGEGKPVEAERKAQRALELVATDESPVRGFIEALARAGDRGAALRFYEKFETVLARELGVEPAPETMAVAEAVRRGEIGPGPGTTFPPAMDGGWRPSGERRPGASPSAAVPRATATRWPRKHVILGAFALAVLVAVGVALGRWLRPDTPEQGGSSLPGRTAIAVLPFQNLSAEGPHAYFAGGLREEVATQLSKVAALTVMGRTSVMAYEGSEKSLQEIAGELGVGSVLEASVQAQGDRLRVNVQLLDAATGQHLWAERYDRTLEDAFAIQSGIAQQVVAAVGAALTESEAAAIAEAPTANPEAYLLYLQGLEYWRRPDVLRRNVEIAQELFERAIAQDSAFALAYAGLSRVHGRMSNWRYDPLPARVARQKEAAEAALRLAPDLPQAHLAMGTWHDVGRRDWEAALEEYRIALAGLPSDAELLGRYIPGALDRLGNTDSALAALEKAVALEPRNADILWDLGGETTRRHRRFPEALDWYNRSVALAPDLAHADVGRGLNWVAWQGQVDSLWAALARHPVDTSPLSWGTNNALRLFWQHQPDSLLMLLERLPLTVFDAQLSYFPLSLYAAWAHRMKGDDRAAASAFRSALSLLDSALAVIPDDWRVHAARGYALAGLGRRQEAQRETRWLQQCETYRIDAHFGPHVAERRAEILAEIGEADAALAEIERLLVEPSWLTVPILRLDPRWDPLRADPRFQALLVKYAIPQPVR